MAIEPRRGCGYRKIGGLYLVSRGPALACDRLPIPLEVCPTCGHGIKQTRGWTWVDAEQLVAGVHVGCRDDFPCPLCMKPDELGRCGLLWIGERFYKTPEEFSREGARLGISRRIHAIPRGFKTGETWILFAHRKAGGMTPLVCPICKAVPRLETRCTPPMLICDRCEEWKAPPLRAGIFHVWRPERIEKILPESMRGRPELCGHTTRCMIEAGVLVQQSRPDQWACFEDCPHVLEAKGITPVYVPADDPDHRGTVYDEEEENEA